MVVDAPCFPEWSLLPPMLGLLYAGQAIGPGGARPRNFRAGHGLGASAWLEPPYATSGTVGTALLDLARYLGLKAIGTCSATNVAIVEHQARAPFQQLPQGQREPHSPCLTGPAKH